MSISAAFPRAQACINPRAAPPAQAYAAQADRSLQAAGFDAAWAEIAAWPGNDTSGVAQ